MSKSKLQGIYQRATEHAEAGEGPREEYLPTEEPSVMVEGMEVRFHLDNSAAIYYDVGDVDDLVYVPAREAGTPTVSAQAFVQRVTELAEEQAERYRN
jgi:hypothetical protein